MRTLTIIRYDVGVTLLKQYSYRIPTCVSDESIVKRNRETWR